MTKTQLKNELSAKFYKVLFPEQAETSEIGYLLRVKEGIFWYLVGVYEERNGVLIRRSIPIYCEVTGTIPKEQKGVLNWEDLPVGNYFYGEKVPQDHIIPELPKTAFRDEVNAKIQAKITDGTIKKGTIEGISEQEEFAVVKAYQVETGEIIEKRYFIYKDTTGTIQISPMK